MILCISTNSCVLTVNEFLLAYVLGNNNNSTTAGHHFLQENVKKSVAHFMQNIEIYHVYAVSVGFAAHDGANPCVLATLCCDL